MGIDEIVSFDLEGNFATFKDPSVTTNQIVTFIPSKSALIGITGAIIGVNRPNSLGSTYSENYVDLFRNTKIGIKTKGISNKITFFTNHRSLKAKKTKPYKSELLEKPSYTIFLQTNDEYTEKITHALETQEFVYSPYLGHMYCPATITYKGKYEASEIDPEGKSVTSVILDESETYNQSLSMMDIDLDGNDNSKIIVERHLHHFMNGGKMDSRVLKHFIPIGDTKIEIIKICEKPKLSRFMHIKEIEEDICMY